MERIMLIIILAFLLDCIIGDPQNPLHPIRLIGRFIKAGVTFYQKTGRSSRVFSFCFGAALSILTVAAAYILTSLLLNGLYGAWYWAGFAAETLLCYFLIAAKALRMESLKVYKDILSGDIQKARLSLSYIVGRDTANLNQTQIINATVETVAENVSDGVIAPLLCALIGGAPLAMAYKAVNTLDSMIGYRDEKFEYFGKFAARLDDIANFIPARISAMMMILGCVFVGGDIKRAVRIYRRDRYHHKSPNSAHTEAVCAGAFGLCLGGDSYYKGVLVHKPTIGDHDTEPAPEHILAANRLMYASVILTIAFMLLASLARNIWIVS